MQIDFLTKTEKIFNKKSLFIFLFVLVAILVINIVWINIDNDPPLWDMAGHSARSAETADYLSSLSLKTLLLKETHYPPFVYLVTAPLYVFGYFQDIPQYSLLIFFAVLLFSVFALTKIITKSLFAAIFAMVITALFPLMSHFSKIYDLDMPLAAMFVLSLLLLVKTKFFSNRNYSLLFGLVAACSLLTKFMFPFFLGPILIVYIIYFFASKQKIKNSYLNLIYSAVIFLIASVPWYFLHYELILKVGRETAINDFYVKYSNLLSMGNISYYFYQTNYGITFVAMALFIVAIIYLIIKKNHAAIFLFASSVATYAILTFGFTAKENRFLLPVYPVIAIIIAIFISKIRFKYIKYGLAGLCVAVLFLFWLQTTWNVTIFNNINSWPKDLRIYGTRHVTEQDPQYGFTHPVQYNSNLVNLVDKIEPKDNVRILVVPNSLFLTSNHIEYYGNLKGIKADYYLSRKIKISKDYENILLEADYVITKTGDQGPKAWSLNASEVAELEQKNPQFFEDNFDTIYEYSFEGVTESSKVKLYKRI